MQMGSIKRGIFRGKKAQTEHESLWTIIELTFFALFTISLLMFVMNVWKNTTYEKNFLARDLALTLDTLYMSPQHVAWLYPYNTSAFQFMMGQNSVRVASIGGSAKQDERRYWFADEEQRKLSYMTEPISAAKKVLFSISPSQPLMISADTHPVPFAQPVPTPVPAPPTGTRISVTSEPAGAEVSFGLGAKPVGNTPYLASIEPGSITIVLRTAGKACRLDFEVVAGTLNSVALKIPDGSTADDPCGLVN
jgi:hypothetical protein